MNNVVYKSLTLLKSLCKSSIHVLPCFAEMEAETGRLVAETGGVIAMTIDFLRDYSNALRARTCDSRYHMQRSQLRASLGVTTWLQSVNENSKLSTAQESEPYAWCSIILLPELLASAFARAYRR